MTLNLERLKTLLKDRPVRFYAQVGSTNDVAREWLRDGALHGAVVIADEQVRGRGRQGRTWHTPPEVALAVSVILHPQSDELPRLSMLGAVAIAEMAEQVGAADVGIKWPNDVQIAGRKLSGVLPEVEWHGSRLVGAVLGMGVNVRTDFAGTPLAESAISLETAVGHPLDRAELVQMLLASVDRWWSAGDLLVDAWQQRLTTLGQQIQVGEITGMAEAVDSQGGLLVRMADNQLQRVIAGDLAMG